VQSPPVTAQLEPFQYKTLIKCQPVHVVRLEFQYCSLFKCQPVHVAFFPMEWLGGHFSHYKCPWFGGESREESLYDLSMNVFLPLLF
jgi:hypothetical protein